MDKITAMRIFVRVAELESFSKAAQSLKLAKASVSTSIQALEAMLSARLLERTTRQVRLTSEGKSFLERCKDILSDMEEIETMFRSDAAKIAGKIRVDMTAPIAREVLLPHLTEFLQKYPQIEIELSSTDRRVDLIREGIDCVVRGGSSIDSGLAERPLGVMEFANVASLRYIKNFGKPQNIEDLKSHHLVFFSAILGNAAQGFEYHDGTKYREAKMSGVITVNSVDAYKAACLAGLGICQIPRVNVLAELKNKTLIEILPQFSSEPMPVNLVFSQKRMLANRVRVFIDWLEPILKEHFK